jgi:hypothetical protein
MTKLFVTFNRNLTIMLPFKHLSRHYVFVNKLERMLEQCDEDVFIFSIQSG